MEEVRVTAELGAFVGVVMVTVEMGEVRAVVESGEGGSLCGDEGEVRWGGRIERIALQHSSN